MVLLNIPDKSYKHNSIDFNGGDIPLVLCKLYCKFGYFAHFGKSDMVAERKARLERFAQARYETRRAVAHRYVFDVAADFGNGFEKICIQRAAQALVGGKYYYKAFSAVF